MGSKRKKMKTRRLKNVVAAITLVLSLSFLSASLNVLGAPVEETSVATDKVQEVTNVNSGNVVKDTLSAKVQAVTNVNSGNVQVVQNVHVADPHKISMPIMGRRDRSGETRPLRGAWWGAYYVDIEIVAGELAR
jgi:hypothetical protein